MQFNSNDTSRRIQLHDFDKQDARCAGQKARWVIWAGMSLCLSVSAMRNTRPSL
jgi:hypothetical protein